MEYLGSKSAYERGDQHTKGLQKKSEDNPIWKHAELHHNSDNNIKFSMKVTGKFKKPMVRQENEAIRIRESMAVHQMNSRSEFHQPVIIRLVPTSSNAQSDQSGTPAFIMDPRYSNKRKVSFVPVQSVNNTPHGQTYEDTLIPTLEGLNRLHSLRSRQALKQKAPFSRSTTLSNTKPQQSKNVTTSTKNVTTYSKTPPQTLFNTTTSHNIEPEKLKKS